MCFSIFKGHFTSEIKNGRVLQFGHRISGSARVVPGAFCPQQIDDIQGVIDVRLIAIERPAEGCWWDGVGRALQCHSATRRR